MIMHHSRLLPLTLGLFAAVTLGACEKAAGPGRFCFGDGRCVEPDGAQVFADGQRICELDNSCDQMGDTTPGDMMNPGDNANPGDNMNPGDTGGGDSIVSPPPGCDCRALGDPLDTDGDCIPDADEMASDPNFYDTDMDMIPDGCEDLNKNGIRDPGELDPNDPDTDNDGLLDGIEDANLNGVAEPGETNGQLADTDMDTIPDGVEDANQNGIVDVGDANGNNCLDMGESPGETDPRVIETDGDQIPDQLEDANQNGVCDPGETCGWLLDTDCDGVQDGREDANRNGRRDATETDPLIADTDGDGLIDGVEDANGNGRYDVGTETDPRRQDSDGDNILDGVEDANQDGIVATWTPFDAATDLNTNGCYDDGEPAGESDPRTSDTDMDGIPDQFEDRDQDGMCPSIMVPNPLNPMEMVLRFGESCPWLTDTDCDGIRDGNEDKNKDGVFQLGEIDPLNPDTDFDQLTDGCPPGVDCGTCVTCEDINNSGSVESGETDPKSADSDGDDLPDGCEVLFQGGPTQPLNEDTDGDETPDGLEDLNRNCIYEPSLGETDPRVVDPPPPMDTLEFAEFEVCSASNLVDLTFADVQRDCLDYQIAFEVEKGFAGTPCPGGMDNECDVGQICEDNLCFEEASYISAPFGQDNNGNGFNTEENFDDFFGHVFQSPPGVVRDAATNQLINRDVYGFVVARESTLDLDSWLDQVRNDFESTFAVVRETSNLPSRPAHDDLPNYEVLRAQRTFDIEVPVTFSSLSLRNNILIDSFLGGNNPDPNNVPPTTDPVYGQIVCPGSSQCYNKFSLYVSAVKRTEQRCNGEPVILTIVALTHDDSDAPDPLPRLYQDRISRLEDLTGGSAVARFAADRGSACENRPQQLAVADLLWVIDDSRSMQQIIERIQQAAFDAQAILTANSGIVDYRVGMTTTNPSVTARTHCPAACSNACGVCDPDASLCADEWLGCIKACPTDCGTGCGDLGGSATTCGVDNYCVGSCFDTGGIVGEIASDASGDFPLPGGGGTFYYEDSHYLDCLSGGASDTSALYINPCGTPSGNYDDPITPFTEFDPFFNGTGRLALTENAGMLGSACSALLQANCEAEPGCTWNGANCEFDAQCATALMDLSFDTEAGLNTCISNPDLCCPRLTEACGDGPTTLASQMCDLIRTMGGLPGIDGFGQPTSGNRSHSAPEHGSRSARRLIESMLPAWPRGYAAAMGMQAEEKLHLRVDCDFGDPGCDACDPRVDSPCDVIPLVTIFLTDEEDYWSKDDCQAAPQTADFRSLPTQCAFRNPCSEAMDQSTCDAEPGCSWDGMNCNRVDCSPLDETDCGNTVGCDWNAGAMLCENIEADCSVDYCLAQGFDVAPPTGYLPDDGPLAPGTNQTFQWRDTGAAECSSDVGDAATTCVGDPCPGLSQTQCGCEPGDMACQTARDMLTMAPPDYDFCYYINNTCVHKCNSYTDDPGPLDPSEVQAQEDACNADAECRFVDGLVRLGQTPNLNACQPGTLLNDCQPCKRFLRNQAAVSNLDNLAGVPGGTQATIDGATLVSFGDVGPVYAIIRDRGEEGFGGPNFGSPEDDCGGGDITWGRGDGNFYRDLATETLGRTQDVCADSYRDFVQLVIRDISVLSSPYPITGNPIAATIKVGIGRPLPAGGFEAVPVERSNTQGFFYDATNNTIGFQSNPIDGECGNGATCDGPEDCPAGTCNGGTGMCEATCAADGTIERTEVLYAKGAPFVPRDGDTIFISYRLWRSVPCEEECADGEVCVRVICQDEGAPSCPGGMDNECPPGYICTGNMCQLDCTPGDLVDVCIPGTQCGLCETLNTSTGLCEPVNDTCLCNLGDAISCDPDAVNTCPVGLACDESCVCQPVIDCPNGFNPDGSVRDCAEALQCCADADTQAADCAAAMDMTACTTGGNAGLCSWDPVGMTCESLAPTCCGMDETVDCFQDPETLQGFLFCEFACTCSPQCSVDELCTELPNGMCGCIPNAP